MPRLQTHMCPSPRLNSRCVFNIGTNFSSRSSTIGILQKFSTLIFIGTLALLLSVVYAAKYDPVPVAPFGNVCALAAARIDEFLSCTLGFAERDGRTHLVDDFEKQTSAFGDLTMGAVVRMMCRSFGDDGMAAFHEYLEALDTDDDKRYMIKNIKLCGGPEPQFY